MSETPRDEGPFWYRFGRYPYLLAKLALLVAVLWGLLSVLRSLESVFFPVFVSVLIAYLLDPYVDRLEARGYSRNLGIGIISAALAVLAIGFVAFLYPLLLGQFVQLTERVPAAILGIDERLLPWIAANTPLELPATLSDTLNEYAQSIQDAAPAVLRRIGSWGASMLARTSSVVIGLLNAVMIPIFAFYFLRDFDRAKWAAAEWIPPRHRAAALSRLSAMDAVVGAWFRGQVQVSLILAVLYAIGLAVVFALTDHSIFDGVAVGVISGLLNVIPYFGFAVGILLALIVVFVEWNGFGGLIGVGAVFAVVQGLEGYVITPRIVGEKVGLSPVTVILVLLIGGEIAGLLGGAVGAAGRGRDQGRVAGCSAPLPRERVLRRRVGARGLGGRARVGPRLARAGGRGTRQAGFVARRARDGAIAGARRVGVAWGAPRRSGAIGLV